MNDRGFTLIETLVALAIFSVVMVMTGGLIFSILSSNRQNQAINAVVNNLNYSVESMVRDIKTGYSYKCDYDVTAGGAGEITTFKDAPSNCVLGTAKNNISLISTITGGEIIVRYDFMPAVGSTPGYIQKTSVTTPSGTPVVSQYPLTDKTNIDIQTLVFKVTPGTPLYVNDIKNTNTGSAGPAQPGVYILLKGTAKVNAINISDFFVQTFVSQRLPYLI